MNITTLVLALTLTVADPLTPGEQRIWETLSVCSNRLEMCRFDLRKEITLKSSLQNQLENPPPPPPPRTEVPALFWIGFGASVAVAFGAGIFIGVKLK